MRCFRDIAFHNLARQLFGSSTGLAGHAGKLGFLLEAELHIRNLR
jgi:hypothetical protein